MEYVESAKELGKKQIFYGVIFLIPGILLTNIAVSEPFSLPSIIAIIFCFSAFFYYINKAYLLLKYGGSWVIKIDQAGLTWNSPNEKINQSFYLSFNDLHCVGTRPSGKSYKRVLLKKDGTSISLNALTLKWGFSSSHVYDDINSFGVPFKRTHDEYTYLKKR